MAFKPQRPKRASVKMLRRLSDAKLIKFVTTN
jgi:hypothetical protein